MPSPLMKATTGFVAKSPLLTPIKDSVKNLLIGPENPILKQGTIPKIICDQSYPGSCTEIDTIPKIICDGSCTEIDTIPDITDARIQGDFGSSGEALVDVETELVDVETELNTNFEFVSQLYEETVDLSVIDISDAIL